MSRVHTLRNPMREARAWPSPPAGIEEFHRRMVGYEVSPLRDAPRLAASLGVGQVLVKTETSRLGLPSFKILGASWATYRRLCDHVGVAPEELRDLSELRDALAHRTAPSLVAATDGNHGRAVAHMARLLGLEAEIFVPADMVPARVGAIEREGARVTVVGGDYDDAVARAAGSADDDRVVISDTSWCGADASPNHVIDGYSTIFAEVDRTIDAAGCRRPDIVVVPVGVGSLMAAAVSHHRREERAPTIIVGVEPVDANCVQRSVDLGEPTHVPGPHRSIMAGLNCGRPSPVAWPRLAAGVDWYVAVDDEPVRRAMRDLADVGIVAGETGAAALAGLHALLDHEAAAQLPPRRTSTVLILVTEGATDDDAYRRIVGRSPDRL